jgi:5-methylthioadenosine/S-adenosylhomocysteine deaminase
LRRRLLPCIGLVLMVFGAWAASAAQKPIDLLVTGGIVITMAGPDIGRGSVAIDKGVIVAVGPSSEVDHRYKPTQRIDAAGTAVIPGLINAHTHGAMTLFRGIADDRALMDWLQNFIFPAEARNVDRDFVKWGTRLAAAEMIASGTTTYVDMYYYEADVARETRSAGLRGILGETVIDFPAPDNKTWDAAVAYCRKFVAEYKDDRLITPALAPHAPYTVSQEHLQEVRRLATELHVPIVIHVAETKDELKQIAEKHNGMGPGQYLDSIGFLGPDVLAAHCVWLTPAEIATFAARGVGVAHCPESNSMLASGVAPVTEMRKAGVHVGLGTDGPAGSNNNLDMIEEMASAARLQKVMRGDPQAISARDVLAMATIDGARAIGMQSKIGSLEVGKRADLAIIDLQEAKVQPVYSIESAIVYAASGDNVVTTICDGRILMRNRKVLTVDVPGALAKAKEYRRKVQESLEKRH